MALTQKSAEKVLAVSPEKAAIMLNLSRNATYEAIRRGDIHAVRVGRRWIVPLASLERLLAGDNV